MACKCNLRDRGDLTGWPEINGARLWIVLATVPGYPAAVRDWNQTGWSSPGCYSENRGTHRVRGRIGTRPRFHITVPSTLTPIKWLSSDCIVTWSVRRLCSICPSFTSRCQIWDWSIIRWIAVTEGNISAEKCGFSIATQRILVRSQMWEREVKEGLKQQNLHTDHVMIRSELRYLIGAKIVDVKWWVVGENPLQRSGSRSEPDPEPNWEFGPIANTTYGAVPSREKSYTVCGSMQARQECVRTNRHCVDRWRVSNSVWDEEDLHNEIMSIFTRVSQHILPITQSISVFPESLLVPLTLSALPLWVYLHMPPAGHPLPHWMVVVARNAFSHHNGLQVNLHVLSIGVSKRFCQLHLSAIWSQIDNAYRDTDLDTWYMPYYDVAKLVTVKKRNMTNKMSCVMKL
jgi:hypothetical protein